MAGQVFAAPVLPFIREVKRFPDEPGARHLTCQLFAHVQKGIPSGTRGRPGAQKPKSPPAARGDPWTHTLTLTAIGNQNEGEALSLWLPA